MDPEGVAETPDVSNPKSTSMGGNGSSSDKSTTRDIPVNGGKKIMSEAQKAALAKATAAKAEIVRKKKMTEAAIAEEEEKKKKDAEAEYEEFQEYKEFKSKKKPKVAEPEEEPDSDPEPEIQKVPARKGQRAPPPPPQYVEEDDYEEDDFEPQYYQAPPPGFRGRQMIQTPAQRPMMRRPAHATMNRVPPPQLLPMRRQKYWDEDYEPMHPCTPGMF